MMDPALSRVMHARLHLYPAEPVDSLLLRTLYFILCMAIGPVAMNLYQCAVNHVTNWVPVSLSRVTLYCLLSLEERQDRRQRKLKAADITTVLKTEELVSCSQSMLSHPSDPDSMSVVRFWDRVCIGFVLFLNPSG